MLLVSTKNFYTILTLEILKKLCRRDKASPAQLN